MLKRISILTLIVLSTLGLAALAPVNASASVTAQDTVVVPTIVVPTIVSTVIVPVTGQPAGTPLSTLLIIGLLVILGFAIIVGGLAMSRAPHDHEHH
jgi:hypothetical protein